MRKEYPPTVEEILELDTKCTDFYQELVSTRFKEDEQFYELDFKSLLKIPSEFSGAGIVLPTGRDVVDTYVDHLDLSNARVTVPARGDSKPAQELRELLRKFYLGLIYMTNVYSDISPWRVAGKHHGLHGVGVLKSVYDADRWLDKPERNLDESEDVYAERLDEWRSESHRSLPIVIQAVNPACIMPDPSYGGGGFVFEKHERLVMDMMERYPKWGNPKDRPRTEYAKTLSFWTPKYRCELIDGEPVLRIKGGVAKHNYGFIPYTIIDAGGGNVSIEGKPEMRYVGILRYIHDLLIAESRNFSVADVILSKVAWGGGFLEGEGAEEFSLNPKNVIDQRFGMWTALPSGVKATPMTPQVPPEALNQHLYRTSDYIAAHAAPRSIRGMGEQGVRSGADRRLVLQEAAAKYRYSTEAFKYGAARVLANCALLMKNVIPGNVRVWAHTPTDEFDIEIDKSKLKEPFVCYVEFSPISEEDEYRRHDSLERLVASGIVTRQWARGQMSNVDPIAMERSEEREKIKNDPAIQQAVSQYIAGKMAEALAKRSSAESIINPPPPIPSAPPGQSIEPGRRMVPPVPERAPLGSAGDIQNQLKGMRSQMPMSPTQGIGINSGGNKP